MTNMIPVLNSKEPLKNGRLSELLATASTILREDWSIDCGDAINCLYQDSTGIVIGTQFGRIKRLDNLGNHQYEFCAFDDESITVIAFWDNIVEGESIIIAGTDKGSIRAFKSDGSILWHTIVLHWVESLYLSPDKTDDVADIIVGTRDGTLYFLDCLGNITDSLSTTHPVLTLATFGKGSARGNFYLGTRDGYVLALNSFGREKWKKPIDGWVYRLHQFRTKDGSDALLTGMQHGDLIAWNSDGKRLWKRSLGYWISSVTTGDVNGDGATEIVAITRNGSMYIMNENGEVLWRWDIKGVVIDAICLVEMNTPARIILIEGRVLKCYSVSGLEADILQNIDILSQDPNALSGLSEHEFKTLGALGLVAIVAEDITYPDLISASANRAKLDRKTVDSFLAQLHTMPLLQVWSHQIPARIDTINWLKDADGTSGLIVGAVDGSVTCWSSTGEINWRFLTMPGNWIWSARSKDINGDGQSEIVLGTKGQKVHVLNRDGEWLNSYSLPQGIRSVFVADLDQDGSTEFLLGCEDATLYVLRSDGTLKWKFPVDGWIRSVIAADVNNDQQLEVICGSRSGKAYELNSNGNLGWEFDAGNWIRVIYACDLNNDGNLLLILGCDNGKVIVLGDDHQVRWTYDIGFRIEAIRMLEIDGKRQLLIGSESQTLYSLTPEGDIAWKFNTAGWVRDIEVADLDNDGCPELVLSIFSVIQSVQKSNYYLQVWKVLDQNRREILATNARQIILMTGG
jgi:hypothetical protein